jgi:hypothetical protein
MKKHIAEELPARKFAPSAPAAKGGGDNEKGAGGKDSASPEKKIRQAVYDIRYRARREDVPLRTAFAQYMQNSNLGGNERAAVKKKLFGEGPMKNEEFIGSVKDLAMESVSDVMVRVFAKEDIEAPKKYKVRVEDNNGKSYVRYADRNKITQLRSNPNIKSVEITSYGEPYEGERKRGEQTAAATAGKDYDGDGKKESSSKEHAGAVHNAIQRKMGGKPDGQDTRKTVSASYEPEGEALDEMRRPKFRYNNTDNSKSSRSHPGRGGGSIRNPQARFNAPNPSTTSSDSSNGDNVKEAVTGGSAPNLPAGVVKFVDELPKTVQNVGQKVFGAKTKPTKPAVEEAHKPGHKKGDGNLANNYPPYDKVTRGDIVAGALGKDQKGGKAKVEEDYLWTEAKTEKKKVDTLPKGESNKVKVFPSNMAEKMDLATADMGDVIKDFRKSKKKQFKGKSKKKKQQMAIAAKLEAERKAGMSEQCDSPVDRFRSRLADESKKKEVAKKEKEEMDIRSLPTSMNLFKNKMRAIGLKMSYEPEGEQIDEMLPALAAGAALLAAPAVIKTVFDKPAKKALDNATNDPNRRLMTGGTVGQLKQAQNNSYEPEGEVIDERMAEDRGEPRKPRDRAVEIVRNMNKGGMMTRSGGTVAQHEAGRGVKKDRTSEVKPEPPTNTPAKKLAAKKAQQAAAQRAAQDMYKPRAGESD